MPKLPSHIENPETSSRKVILAGVAVVVVFGAFFVAWGLLASLHGAVQAQGTVMVDTHRKTVQHLEGGIINSILVREGDRVVAGQPLIILADLQAKATVELLSGQIDNELAAMARLEAEKNGLPRINFPQTLLSRRATPSVAEVIQAEEKLFKARQESFNTQLDVLRNQIGQVREEIKGLLVQQEENAREMRAIDEQLASHKELLKQGYVTRTSVLDIERMHAEKSGVRAQIAAAIARSNERSSELQLKIAWAQNDRTQQAADEIKKSQARRMEYEDRVKSPRDTLSRMVVRAPISGRVVDLKVTTVGGVISGREPLMDVVPENDRLIVEAHIGVDDIADVAMGQKADMTLTAFKSSTTPPVIGTVTHIGADRLTMKAGNGGEIPYYQVHLEIDPASLKNAGVASLQPGMSAAVQIRTRPRTAVDYLLSPLILRSRKAFHDK